MRTATPRRDGPMLTKPAIIWALDFEAGRATPCPDEDALGCAPGPGDFRWLHLNLADQWTRRWIEGADALPAPLREMLLSSEQHQRAVVDQGYVGCVLHDIERDFDQLDTDRTGVLRLVRGAQLLGSVRH